MKLLCAWCEKEGKPALLANVEPIDDPQATHGICPEHRRVVEEAIEQRRREARELQDELKALRDQVDP